MAAVGAIQGPATLPVLQLLASALRGELRLGGWKLSVERGADFQAEGGGGVGFSKVVAVRIETVLRSFLFALGGRDEEDPDGRVQGTKPFGELLAGHLGHRGIGNEEVHSGDASGNADGLAAVLAARWTV